jgi:hypothetical protein
MENYNLFLDDIRKPFWIREPIYNKLEWVIIKSYSEFTKYIMDNGIPNTISFDHDLSDIHYLNRKENFNYDKIEKTGYHCLKWLCDYIIDKDLKLPKIMLFHTSNPIGKKNMETYLSNFIKFFPEYCD